MRTLGAFAQRALDRARHLIKQSALSSRWLPALALALALTSSVSVLGASAQAYPDPSNPPTERLQYVINSIHVRDDQDTFGSGEMRLGSEMCIGETSPTFCKGGPRIAWNYNYSANSGTTRTFDHVVPTGTDTAEGGATEGTGLPIYASETYHLLIWMNDEDELSDDFMGYVAVAVDAAHDWSLGTHTARSIHNDGSPGDFDVTFEIRRAPLADLKISGVQEVQSADGLYYCVQIGNVGQEASAAFILDVAVDGPILRSPVMPSLGVNETTEHCIKRTEISAIQHTLSLSLDQAYKVPEMNEMNNHFEYTIPALATPTPSPTPTPTTKKGNGKGRADLTVESIEIGGQTPDGKNVCKTKLTVTVKNDGDTAADPFVLRVAVEDSKADPTDKTVTGLDAGQQQTISFEGIHLDSGEHKIKAIADPDHATSESKEGNNERKVSARCEASRY